MANLMNKTKAQLVEIIENLEKQIKLLDRKLGRGDVSDEGYQETPDPAYTPGPNEPVEGYGPYDEHFCREYYPQTAILNRLLNSDNRYEKVAGIRMKDELSKKVLVKPEEGFTSDEHELFFQKSWNGNRNLAHVISPRTGYAKGKVYTEFRKMLWSLPFKWVVGQGTKYVEGAFQPVTGNLGPDVARTRFEEYTAKEGVLNSIAMDVIFSDIHAADYRYKNNPTTDQQALEAARIPGWIPDDGSEVPNW